MATSVVDYLEHSAEKYPDKEAFTGDGESMTFSRLREESRCVASYLLSHGCLREPVVVFMEKSVKCIGAFMGVASAGAFYVPIDPNWPAARVGKILDTLQARFAIVDDGSGTILEASGFSGEGIEYSSCLHAGCDNQLVDDAISGIIDTDLLYVLFTSGSTGVPKGVAIRHLSVIDYIERLVEVFGFTSRDVLANQAPFYFDNSVLDIYVALKTGATAHIVPKRLFSFPVKLLEELKVRGVTCIFWVPSALMIVANLKALTRVNVTTLDKVLFAGEVMPAKQLNMWRKQYQNALFANLYGPTEIAVDCTYYIVDREFSDSDSVPIGIPFRNSDVLVFSDDGRLVVSKDVGAVGELCVRGSSLSCGYYNNPQKTMEAFVQNPLVSAYPEIIYKTGDLVRYNARGELEYVSRKDFQIKRFGHRVELGEIENACSSFDGVDCCCCLYRQEAGELVLAVSGTFDEGALEKHLGTQLPTYMLPSRIVRFDALPLTGNGKIDRLTLADMV